MLSLSSLHSSKGKDNIVRNTCISGYDQNVIIMKKHWLDAMHDSVRSLLRMHLRKLWSIFDGAKENNLE